MQTNTSRADALRKQRIAEHAPDHTEWSIFEADPATPWGSMWDQATYATRSTRLPNV